MRALRVIQRWAEALAHDTLMHTFLGEDLRTLGNAVAEWLDGVPCSHCNLKRHVAER